MSEMPKESYRTITIRKEVYETLATIADIQGKSISELVSELVWNYVNEGKDKGFMVDLMGELGIDLAEAINRHAKPRIEVDETDHIIFRCPKCGESLALLRIGYSGDAYGTLYLYFLCPLCGTVMYRKTYATGFPPQTIKISSVEDIPRIAHKALSTYSRAEYIIEDTGSTVLASLAPSGYGVGFRKHGVCIDAGILDFPAVKSVLGYYGVSSKFFKDYPKVSNDNRMVLINDKLCFSYDYFADVYRRILNDIAKQLKPSHILSDGTQVYEFTTDFYKEPPTLLKPLYGIAVAEAGTLLSGMDALRSIYRLTTIGGFDIIEDCMEKTAEYARNAKNYKQLLETIAPIADSCTRHPSALQQLWSTAEALAVFPLERKRRKSIQKAVIVFKPREGAKEEYMYEKVA
ncbi:hypothetical protein Pdsh_01325 [Pyrodictium delaneyi]|uniref:Uncharacterized protein n=2 Tax=Pyrodictium delaneyi TaxID=1273541 RepID=A0A211YRN7_9CREN|nr:hypothetical protein Pdsh_01325 [Pyrodictium delaneyi]